METATLTWHSSSRWEREADHNLDDIYTDTVVVSDDDLAECGISLTVSFFCSDDRLIFREDELRDGTLALRRYFDLGEFVNTSPISNRGIVSVKRYADYVLQGYLETRGMLAHCPSCEPIFDRDDNFNPIA